MVSVVIAVVVSIEETVELDVVNRLLEVHQKIVDIIVSIARALLVLTAVFGEVKERE